MTPNDQVSLFRLALEEVKASLKHTDPTANFRIINYFNVAGSGKSYFLKTLMEDPDIRQHTILYFDFDRDHQSISAKGETISWKALIPSLANDVKALAHLPENPPPTEVGEFRFGYYPDYGPSSRNKPLLVLLDHVNLLDDLNDQGPSYWKWVQDALLQPLLYNRGSKQRTLVIATSHSPLYFHFWDLRAKVTVRELKLASEPVPLTSFDDILPHAVAAMAGGYLKARYGLNPTDPKQHKWSQETNTHKAQAEAQFQPLLAYIETHRAITLTTTLSHRPPPPLENIQQIRTLALVGLLRRLYIPILQMLLDSCQPDWVEGWAQGNEVKQRPQGTAPLGRWKYALLMQWVLPYANTYGFIEPHDDYEDTRLLYIRQDVREALIEQWKGQDKDTFARACDVLKRQWYDHSYSSQGSSERQEALREGIYFAVQSPDRASAEAVVRECKTRLEKPDIEISRFAKGLAVDEELLITLQQAEIHQKIISYLGERIRQVAPEAQQAVADRNIQLLGVNARERLFIRYIDEMLPEDKKTDTHQNQRLSKANKLNVLRDIIDEFPPDARFSVMDLYEFYYRKDYLDYLGDLFSLDALKEVSASLYKDGVIRYDESQRKFYLAEIPSALKHALNPSP